MYSIQSYAISFSLFISCSPQVITERETDMRNAQEQSSRLQTEMTQLRQELQDKASQEERLRKQMSDKEEKCRKAIVGARQRINQLVGKRASLL